MPGHPWEFLAQSVVGSLLCVEDRAERRTKGYSDSCADSDVMQRQPDGGSQEKSYGNAHSPTDVVFHDAASPVGPFLELYSLQDRGVKEIARRSMNVGR